MPILIALKMEEAEESGQEEKAEVEHPTTKQEMLIHNIMKRSSTSNSKSGELKVEENGENEDVLNDLHATMDK